MSGNVIQAQRPGRRPHSAEEPPALDFRGVSKSFSTAQGPLRVLKDASFTIGRAESVALTGESGSGKSTILHLVAGLEPFDAGDIAVAGVRLAQMNDAERSRLRRAHIGVVFQQFNLVPSLRVMDNIAFQARVAGRLDGSWISQLLERLGLAALTDRYPEQLSGGQQQRVAIARALISRPQFVICDEPTSMLDVSIQAQVLELMLELKAEFNLTYLFVTHDLSVARYLCDRIAVMHRGQIVELGDTAAVFEHPQHPYTQTLLAAAPQLVPETQDLAPA